MKRKLKGKLTISKVTSNTGPGFVKIAVVDASSGVEALEVNMPLKEFAESLFGMGHVACDCEWAGLELIGKRREVKTESVSLSKWPNGRDKADQKAVRAAVAAFEVDGWEGWDDDCFNGHKLKGTGKDTKASVTFVRFVEEANGN